MASERAFAHICNPQIRAKWKNKIAAYDPLAETKGAASKQRETQADHAVMRGKC